MKNKVLKTVVAIALLIAITMSDFALLGTSLVSYALESIEDVKTSHDNVKFQAYFKTEKGEKIKSTSADFNSDEIKLYMAVEVLEDGYFDGKINISESNFNIKSKTIENKYVNKVEGNTITLNTIRVGDGKVEIEVEVEPIKLEEYKISLLNQESKVNLEGTYKDGTEKNIPTITASKAVQLNLTIPNEINIQASSEVITNKVYKVKENGVEENKKIVQLEIEKGIENDVYPIKSTKFEIDVLTNSTIVEVISKGTQSTNGETERKLTNSEYTYNETNGKLILEIENEENEGNITWTKGKTDKIVVTYMLDAGEVTIGKEIKTKITTTFYGNETKEVETTAKIEKETDGMVEATVDNEETSMYKGKIYSKENRDYNTTTNIEVNYAGIADNIEINQQTVYGTEVVEEEKTANIEYKTTTITRTEFEKVLGTDAEAKITIKDQDGNLVKEVTIADFDTTGKATITYGVGVKGINILITKPVSIGTIRLNHVKTIKPETYGKVELQTIKTLLEKTNTKYSTSENDAVERTYERKTNLLETKTEVILTVEPQVLSTAITNDQVKIAMTLRTDDEKFDLFGKTTLTIKLPDSVKSISNVKTNPNCLDTNNLEIDLKNYKYNPETKELSLILNGQQLLYTGTNNQPYIEILADIELEETTPNKLDKITLTYTNENAVSYANDGKSEVEINLIGHSGVVAYNKITNYNVKASSVTVNQEQIGTVKMNSDQAEANFEIAIVNNTGAKIENVNILGNLPVQGEITVGETKITNTIAATLKEGINTNGVGTVYYTSNANATENLYEESNGWNANLAEVTNPKLYMIVIGSMEAATSYKATYKMTVPANLQYNVEMKTTYTVSYVSQDETKIVKVGTVGLETGKVLVKLDATLSGEELINGAKIQTGEVIRYKITAVNNGGNDVQNVKIVAPISNGTVYVTPMEDFEYAEPFKLYYEEHTNQTTYETTIETLKAGETKEIEYEVRVKTDAQAGTVVSNQLTGTYGEGIELKSNTINNTIEQGKLRVTVKRRSDLDTTLIPEQSVQYYIIVENISDAELTNIDLAINLPEGLDYNGINIVKDTGSEVTNTNVKISKIAAGDYNAYMLFGKVEAIEELTRNIQITATATHGEKTYKSNAYKDIIYGLKLEMTMEATRGEEYLMPGDIVEYTIKINNKSQIISNAYTVKMEIPKQMTIQSIKENGTETEILHENYFNKNLSIAENDSLEIKIAVVVDYDPTRDEIEKVSTIAELLYLGEQKIVTNPIIHYLESLVEEPEVPDEPEIPEVPDEPEIKPVVPVDPTDPNEPIVPEEPENPETPEQPEQPDEPEDPETKKYNIAGKAWIDQDKDGEMNNGDTILKGINVKLLNTQTNQFVRNAENTKDLVVVTGEDGYYSFENIVEGKYIVVFEYDITLYKPTVYKKNDVEENKNSNVISKTLTINQEEKEYAVTDEIILDKNISSIDMGLVFTKQFDIVLEKNISKIIVQTSKGITTYEYKNEDFAKIELHKNQMVGATIIVQYTIKATNVGDVDAYISTIVDYAPKGLKFNSELNTNWYEVGGDLFTNSLANTAIKSGESKEINLTLTKTITEGNAELINNIAEIQEAYNIYGIADMNSTQGNNNKDENDLGTADLIISIQTGNAMSYIALVILMISIIGIGVYFINKKVIKMNK